MSIVHNAARFRVPMGNLVLVLVLLLSEKIAVAQPCAALNDEPSEQPWLDENGLLPARRNPASVLPLVNPQAIDPAELVPAVPMASEVCAAIRLFDATAESERYYDLVNCLDGLTFGFGNWPQGELGSFFQQLSEDAPAEQALVRRFMEVFKVNGEAWNSFKKEGKLSDTIDAVTVRAGIKILLSSAKMKNIAGLNNRSSDGSCSRNPKRGHSYYFDHAKWLVPTLTYAFRDPAVVAFQVKYWNDDILAKARKYTDTLSLPPEGLFLMAFYESNPGQISSSLRSAINREEPPIVLQAGNRRWKWDGTNRPSALADIPLDRWHTLLTWQSMCPISHSNFRIRNRNLKFFFDYLAIDFEVPSEIASGTPSSTDFNNCNPAKVQLRKEAL